MKLLAVYFLCVLCLTLIYSLPVLSQEDSETLEKAVASLRNVKSEDLTIEQQKAKAQEIDESWKYLISLGQRASLRLKQEIEKVDAGKERDDFFKLNATVLFWEIGKTDEAEYIAKVWSSTPIHAQYTYVFLTAFEAAQTQDPKVLPMLRAILKDNKGSMYVGLHAMNVEWPLSHEFIWGAYGPTGLPFLAEVLETSKDAVEINSAMLLLTRAQYLPALTRIRQLTTDKRNEVRRAAIQNLGAFGHPDDFDLLVSGLRSDDPKELFSYAFALYEFDDLRAVPLLIPLLDKNDDNLTVETFVTLLHLLTPESYAAVKSRIPKLANIEIRDIVQQRLSFIQKELPAGFEKKPKAEQAKILAAIRDKGLTATANDASLSNKQLKDAAKEWKEHGRMGGSVDLRYSARQIISAAGPDDIDMLLEAKAKFYRRLSDECLYETRDIDTAVKYIGRSRYRKGIGISERAEKK